MHKHLCTIFSTIIGAKNGFVYLSYYYYTWERCAQVLPDAMVNQLIKKPFAGSDISFEDFLFDFMKSTSKENFYLNVSEGDYCNHLYSRFYALCYIKNVDVSLTKNKKNLFIYLTNYLVTYPYSELSPDIISYTLQHLANTGTIDFSTDELTRLNSIITKNLEDAFYQDRIYHRKDAIMRMIALRTLVEKMIIDHSSMQILPVELNNMVKSFLRR